jgi:exodeoxyribonuclease VII large subunit
VKTVNGRKIYSVSEINYFAKETLEQMVVWVEGEVSSFKKNPNWSFYYLDLKDDKANISCIASGSVINSLGEDVLNQTVIAFGNLTLYEAAGKYQLRIQHIELSGGGQLYKKLEDLIKKLRQEGLFDSRHKKIIPQFPKKICLVSSVGSDGWNDFKTHSVDKFPIIELFSADIRVQGPKSIPDLLKILPLVDKQCFDVIVITRGGGSMEDLAAFNDEAVAKAIFNMKTPTVVAIGHEANESLAEWTADIRASTPTDAANIITRGWQTILDKLGLINQKLMSKHVQFNDTYLQKLDSLYFKLSQEKIRIREYPHRLSSLQEALRRHERTLVIDQLTKQDELFSLLKKGTNLHINNIDTKLFQLQRALILLSPENTLKRGYSITTDKKGNIIKSARDVVVGQTLDVKLADGKLRSQVKSKSSL